MIVQIFVQRNLIWYTGKKTGGVRKSRMGKKNEKEKSKKDEIVKRREAEGFLPKYSERYFAGKGKSRLIWGFICAFIGIEAFLAAEERAFYSAGWNMVAFFSIAVVIYVIWPCGRVLKRKKMLGFWLRQEGIEQELFFGGTRMLPYSYYDGLLCEEKYYYKDSCFQIGKGRDKLCFPYEIGNQKAKNHVHDFHKRLRPYLNEKMPTYYSCCGVLDRKYFYRKNRRIHSAILWVTTLVFWGLRSDITRIGQAGVCGAVVGAIASIALYYIFKDAVLEQKVWDDLKKKLPDCWSHVQGNPYMGWIVFWIETGFWIFVMLMIILFAGE